MFEQWTLSAGRIKQGSATIADVRYVRCTAEHRALLAAAPDLLAALKYARRFLDEEDADLRVIDAAILKAEGK